MFLSKEDLHNGARIDDAPVSPQRGLHGKFLHITGMLLSLASVSVSGPWLTWHLPSDFHPDEYYKPSTSENNDCHYGKGDAGLYGTELSGCDSSFSLVDATFDWIAEHLKDEIDFVIWTGDSARHDNDDDHPRTAAEILRTNQYLVDQMRNVFSDNKNRLSIPIIPNIGNNDFLPHNVLLPGPNRWLKYYGDMWRAFIPEEQRHAFESGGWYSVEVIPNELAVFSLNTMYFFDQNPGIDGCVSPLEPGFMQMEWLRIQLQRLRERGMKAILMGHVPPVKTASKEPWVETCWQKYNLWMRQYRDVVVGSMYGHMNVDHFVLHDTKDIDIRLLGGVEAEAEDYGLESYEDDEDSDEEEYDEDNDEEEYDEDEMSTFSFKLSGKSKYLLDLRRAWAKLPEVTSLCNGTQQTSAQGKKGRKGKKKKGSKKLGGKWAERYHLSFVSPSVVPNFFPSIRVFEYNITGLEHTPTWGPVQVSDAPANIDADGMAELEREVRQAKAVKRSKKNGGKGRKKDEEGTQGKKGKKGKKDPNLVVPDPPGKNEGPGPAYARQPLTWLGYTQYFANITRINAQVANGESGDGVFQYEVEYDTFTDKLYRLKDMTVKNYVKLAYRIGLAKKKKGKGKASGWFEDDDEGDEWGEIGEGEHEDEGDEFEAESIECEVLDAGKKKKRRRRASNRAWRRFVKHAFVSTGYEEGQMDGFSEEDEREVWDEL